MHPAPSRRHCPKCSFGELRGTCHEDKHGRTIPSGKNFNDLNGCKQPEKQSTPLDCTGSTLEGLQPLLGVGASRPASISRCGCEPRYPGRRANMTSPRPPSASVSRQIPPPSPSPTPSYTCSGWIPRRGPTCTTLFCSLGLLQQKRPNRKSAPRRRY